MRNLPTVFLAFALVAIFLQTAFGLQNTESESVRTNSDVLKPGDLLGFHLHVYRGKTIHPKTRIPTKAGLKPFIGDPIQILEGGFITPYLEPVKIGGLTVADANTELNEQNSVLKPCQL